MKIAILLYEGVTALDSIGPYEVLSRVPNARVYFVAKQKAPILTDTGMLTLMPELSLKELPNPDILLIPGSTEGFKAVMADEEVLGWIRTAHETTQWTTSVCTGSLILGAAGLLQGLEATTHWAAAPILPSLGARYTAKRVVRQGKIVMGAGVSAGIDMALTLVGEMSGQETAESIQLVIEYDPQPPFQAGSPEKASRKVQKLARGILVKEP
jgi:putative intracellular protease/amidase